MDNNSKNSNKNDVKDYAKRYGYEALGIAIIKMMEHGDFTPDKAFANALWEYDGVACKYEANTLI